MQLRTLLSCSCLTCLLRSSTTWNHRVSIFEFYFYLYRHMSMTFNCWESVLLSYAIYDYRFFVLWSYCSYLLCFTLSCLDWWWLILLTVWLASVEKLFVNLERLNLRVLGLERRCCFLHEFLGFLVLLVYELCLIFRLTFINFEIRVIYYYEAHQTDSEAFVLSFWLIETYEAIDEYL